MRFKFSPSGYRSWRPCYRSLRSTLRRSFSRATSTCTFSLLSISFKFLRKDLINTCLRSCKRCESGKASKSLESADVFIGLNSGICPVTEYFSMIIYSFQEIDLFEFSKPILLPRHENRNGP